MQRMRVQKILLAILLLGPAVTAREQDEEMEKNLIDALVIRNGVTFSEIEESGRKHWEVLGSRAESQSEDVIRIYNVTARIMQENGDDITVLMDVADINRRTREIETDVYVEIIQGDRYITGTGMRIDTEKRHFHLMEDVKITFFRQESDEMGLNAL